MDIKALKAFAAKYVAAAFSFVFLYQAAFGYWQVQFSRGLYILFALVLAFLINPNRKKDSPVWVEYADLLFILVSLAGIGYFMFNFEAITLAAGLPLSELQLGLGFLTIFVVLEASRRTVGWPLAILAFSFVLYTYFGQLMPTIIRHRGYSVNRIISVMYTSTEGIFGSVVYVFATFIFLFIVFGAFLQASGAGKFFIEIAKAAVGRFTGGAAQSAVVSSWLIGSVIGSSTANTAITGSVTIPMMINRGYKRHVAAAVEAVVSIGGQFMPPIMGAAAFLIAAFVGIPYIEVARAGLLPAMLFFLSMVFMVYLEARRNDLRGIPKDELPSLGKTFLLGWYYFVPIGLIIALLINGNSPSLAGFYAIVSTVIISWFRKDTRMMPKDIFNAMVSGGRSALAMSTTAGAVGILVAAISLPGLGMRISSIIVQLAGGNLPIALILVMAASFVLGMGMNVSSAYLILIVITAPALVEMGVPLLTAHFFVFWTSQLSVITPPVALSAYVAAAIAEADVWKTGWHSLRMGFAIYYIPIMFVYIPSLLWVGSAGTIVWSFTTTLVGVLAFSSLMQGYLLSETTWYDRALLATAAGALVFTSITTDLIGFTLIAAVISLQYFRGKALKPSVTV